MGFGGSPGGRDARMKDVIIEELQKKYTDARNVNKAMEEVVRRHGLRGEVEEVIRARIRGESESPD